MLNAAELNDVAVADAVSGSGRALSQVAEVFLPQVRMMVAARLSADPTQFHAVDELSQRVMLGLTAGIARLEARTVRGLRAYLSGIVSREVADFLARRGSGAPRLPGRSLDSTIATISSSAPMWQFLSDSGVSPSSAADRGFQAKRLIEEMGRLKPEHRDALTYAFFDQLPTAEIAQRMGITRRAAAMLALRAVRAIRKNMTGSSQAESS